MNIDELIAKLRDEGRHETYAPATQAEIDKTETALGKQLPDSYKRFVSELSNGAWCFVVAGDPPANEYVVAYLDTGGRKLYGKQSGFTAWLSILVSEQDEVIRSLYGDDVIYGELGLG